MSGRVFPLLHFAVNYITFREMFFRSKEAEKKNWKVQTEKHERWIIHNANFPFESSEVMRIIA